MNFTHAVMKTTHRVMNSSYPVMNFSTPHTHHLMVSLNYRVQNTNTFAKK